ncbi:alpha/beta fold hydrolase [Streptomyces globisporus]|uniref:alpha/beta fold hydrolase n=1 Tax=Streptomyces globisporus TaxID=1908 RepID=UPI0038655AD7
MTHHIAAVNGTHLHYVRSGATGSPVLLVHGFPESWWAFHKVIPQLARCHRVIAVDMRGFGDSAHEDTAHDSATLAADLLALIDHLDFGPVQLLGQDISSTVTFRAALDERRVRSYTAIEVGLPGHGLDPAMDVTSGGSWHFGFFAAPGIAEMLLRGHAHEFLKTFAYGASTLSPTASGPPAVSTRPCSTTGPSYVALVRNR